MAYTSVFVFVLVLGASVSLPISRDGETVQSTKSLSESEVTERTPVLDIEKVRSLDEEIKPVPSSNTVLVFEGFVKEENHVKRNKRSIAKPSQLCPGDMIEYHDRCWTPEEYDDIAGDDYNGGS